jgi:AcrR family transcriptional regulator
MDRRVRKTRQAILEAFVELLTEKGFEHMTMNQIADRADVNRGTVYLHYMDKYDLLDQCIETHLAQLLGDCLSGGAPHQPTKAAIQHLFVYLEQHAFLYRTLLANKGIPAFRYRLMDVMLRIVREYLDERGSDRTMNKEVSAHFLASAVIGVLEWWVTQSMPSSTTDTVDQIWSLLESTLVGDTSFH